MKRLVHYAEARRILSKVALADQFWLCTNQNLRNLFSLALALEDVDDDVFRYHVNRDKNDFEVWIRDIIKDRELAREISRVKTKETLVRKIMERVRALRKVVRLHKALLERKRAKKAVEKRKAKASKSRKRGVRKRRH
ncbi:hypothetical protein J4470_01325 [Candidatus Woesearchaeota archaeon]|nr:hypothetical protein [Candidatus Woesearchaeota archaeon]